MYRKIDDFIYDYQIESGNTKKIFGLIVNSKKHIKLHVNVRSMERLAWHITQSLSEMMFRCGLTAADDLENKPVPGSIQEIIKIYDHHTRALISLLKSRWKDSELEEKMDFFGQKMAKGQLLKAILTHEIHHRGQLTVVMRLLENPVSGVYGPAKEEWAQYNMPAME
jgi:uncharacterized damage-inducible protein DinB